jgi:hypothetical protein
MDKPMVEARLEALLEEELEKAQLEIKMPNENAPQSCVLGGVSLLGGHLTAACSTPSKRKEPAKQASPIGTIHDLAIGGMTAKMNSTTASTSKTMERSMTPPFPPAFTANVPARCGDSGAWRTSASGRSRTPCTRKPQSIHEEGRARGAVVVRMRISFVVLPERLDVVLIRLQVGCHDSSAIRGIRKGVAIPKPEECMT